MTEALKKILAGAGYLDLFLQHPAPVTEVDASGLEIDEMNMANDWRNVGRYLDNAVIEWRKQQDIHSNGNEE